MLVLTRKPGQSIKIEPNEGLCPTTPVGRLFADGPMEIVVLRVERNQVKIGIAAHSGLKILRDELSGGDPLENQRGREGATRRSHRLTAPCARER